MNKGTRVYCAGSRTTGTLVEDTASKTLVRVQLDSGLTAVEFVEKLSELVDVKLGDRVALKSDAYALGDVVRIVNSLFVGVRFDKAITTVTVPSYKLRILARASARQPVNPPSARAQKEADALRAKQAATKAAHEGLKIAAQADAAKKQAQKAAQKNKRRK